MPGGYPCPPHNCRSLPPPLIAAINPSVTCTRQIKAPMFRNRGMDDFFLTFSMIPIFREASKAGWMSSQRGLALIAFSSSSRGFQNHNNRQILQQNEGTKHGVGDHDITEFDITESDVTFFQEFDITESDITEKGNFYNGIRYNGICYNMKLEIGITKFVTVESDITGKWKLI